MADDVQIVVGIRGDTSGGRAIKQSLDQIATSGDKAVSSTKKLELQAKATAAAGNALGQAFAAAAAIFGARQIVAMADGYRLLESRVKSIAGSVQETGRVMGELRKISDQTGSSMEASVAILQRLSFVRNEIKATNNEMLAFTETVTKLGIMSGASNDALKAGLTQLGQGLSSQILRAEEFNSIMENIPGVGKAIADQFGVTTGQLRQLVVAGQVLSGDVFAAIINQNEIVRKQFEDMPRTAEQGFNQMLGRVTQVVDEINRATNGTNALGAAFRGVGEFVKRVYDGAAAAFSYVVAGLGEAINLILVGFNKALEGINALKRAMPAWVPINRDQVDMLPALEVGSLLKSANDEAVARQSRLFAGATKDINVETRQISKNYSEIASKLGTSTKLTKEQREALKAQKKIQDELKDAVSESRTETEKLYDKIAEQEALRPFAKTAEQATAISKNIKNAQDELEKLRIKAELDGPAGKAFQSLAKEIDDDFKDAFKSAFTQSDGGFKKMLEGWKNAFKNFLADLAYQALLRPVMVSLVGGVGGAMGISQSAIASVLGTAGKGGVASSGGGISSLLGMGSSLFSAGSSLLSGGTSTLLTTGLNRVGNLLGIGGVGANGPVSLSSYSSFTNGSFGGTLGAGAAAFGGNLLGNAIFGNNRGIGSSIGGAIGGFAGSFIPVPILGPLVGSFVGNAIGGLFGGKKPSDKSQWGSIDFATLAQTSGGLGGKKYSAQNASMRDTIINQIAGVLGLVKEYGGSATGSAQITVGNRDGLRYNGQNFGTNTTSFTNAIFGDLKNSITGLDKTFQTILDKLGVTSSVDSLTSAFAFGKSYNDTLAAAKPLTETLAESIKALNDNMTAAIQTATNLGLPIDEYTKALQKQKDAAIGALKAQAAGFQSLEDMTNAFKNFLNGQALSDTSSLSPAQKLQLAQDSFGGLLSKAQGGDLSVTQDLLAAANQLLQIGRGVYASSLSFAGLEGFVRSSVSEIARAAGVPGYAVGTDHARPGLAWVGENGPELVRMRGGERVFTNTESMAMTGNNGEIVALLGELIDVCRDTLGESVRGRKLMESMRNKMAVTK